MLTATISPKTGKSSLSPTVSSFGHLLKLKTYGETPNFGLHPQRISH